MIKNYLKTAIRNFTKDIRFSLINLIGFSLGLFGFLVIIFYVKHESGYDLFHENAENIYRMGWDMKSPEGLDKYSVTTAGPAPDIYEHFPSVKAFCRFSYGTEGFFSYNKRDFKAEKFFYADSGFFEVFSYKLLQGNPQTCLSDPFSVVLSNSIAKSIFGDEDPVGKIIKWDNQHDFLITGIIEDPPADSHLKYSALASFSTLYTFNNIFLGWDGGVSYFSYFLFENNTSPADLGKKFDDLYYDNINHKYEQGGWKVIPRFENITDIHLYSEGEGDIAPRGNPENNKLFLVIAIIILTLACVNFMNLSSARYSARSEEVAIRKVFGATRPKLIRQFLGESILIVSLATVIALILIEAALPYIQNLSKTEFSIYSNKNLIILVSIPLIILTTGVLAGSYPALFLSSFKPASIFRNRLNVKNRGISFRNILVIFQFAVSISLIICTFIVLSQMRFMINKDLGFDKENMIALQITSDEFREKHVIVQDEISRINDVISTAASVYFPGIGNTAEGYRPEGQDKSVLINRIAIDHNYPSTMELKIKQGRAFSREFPTDSSAFLVNESFARRFGWDSPVGKYINRDGKHKIIGVVEDFHYSSMHSPISPLIMNLVPYYGFNYIIVKFKTENFSGLIHQIKDTWKSIDPDEPFNYLFIDDYLRNAYEKEIRFSKIFLIFTILATVLASLGLFGLAAFEAEKRKKEIGIRKILGSTVTAVTGFLVSNFLRLVIISNLIAWPVAYFLMKRWLEDYEFRNDINPLIFVFAAVLSLLIAVTTVWSRSYRIANMNPADTIRVE